MKRATNKTKTATSSEAATAHRSNASRSCSSWSLVCCTQSEREERTVPESSLGCVMEDMKAKQHSDLSIFEKLCVPVHIK